MPSKNEESYKDHFPRQNEKSSKKGSLSKKVDSNYCAHCEISGHWIDKCWKIHTQLNPRHGKEVVQEPAKEKVADEIVGQEPTL
jgi:hypothetical protein